MDSLAQQYFPGCQYGSPMIDVIFERGVGFSIPGAVIIPNQIFLLNYSSRGVSLPELRLLLGNCIFTGSKGILYYDASKTVSSNSRTFAAQHNTIIISKGITPIVDLLQCSQQSEFY
jgi:hypothetical protein